MENPVKKQHDGIYSYFIRGINPRVSLETINEIKQYAVKVVEAKESTLMVGKNWIIVVKRICDSEYERIEVRCFKDMCEPYERISTRYIEYVDGVIENVEVDCDEQEIATHDIAYYMCRIKYNYCRYNAIIAITVDPLDIHILNNDKELQLLLDLMPVDTLLVRPM